MERMGPHLRPKRCRGEAIAYARNGRRSFRVFLDHGELPMHNNISETQLRQAVVGRKTWRFAGSEGGAMAAATCFTLRERCMLRCIDPWAHLVDVPPWSTRGLSTASISSLGSAGASPEKGLSPGKRSVTR
jgi:hypothetical protein